jgi:hypothetical protein
MPRCNERAMPDVSSVMLPPRKRRENGSGVAKGFVATPRNARLRSFGAVSREKGPPATTPVGGPFSRMTVPLQLGSNRLSMP